jgi:hypothetical protein
LKIKYSVILLISLVTIALAVSGCSGGNTGATATPTPQPGSTTVTPAPTATGATPAPTQSSSGAGTLGSLYKTGQFKWYEYTTNIQSEGTTMQQTAKTEFLGPEMHEGKMQNHMRVTTSMSIPGVPAMPPTVMDFYSDPNAATSNASKDYTTATNPLVKVGPDTVNINGKTYSCTKYTVTLSSDDGQSTGEYWSSPDVPMPVQYATITKDGTMISQLTGWG